MATSFQVNRLKVVPTSAPWIAPAPVPLTPLIGREPEVDTAQVLLRCSEARLLTLIGPGGIGKTHLALKIADGAGDAFADGVRFVSLAAVPDAGLVASTLASALGIYESGAATVRDTLAVALRDTEALLILDNFEHLLAAAPLLTDLLSVCPRLTLLVTSRTPLRIAGEQVLPVPPLVVPDPNAAPSVERLMQAPAVRLFVERAHAATGSFTLTEAAAPLVADICRRLDGVPLAIELAAARVAHLTLPALLERMERRLSLLTSGGPDRPDRHRTMRDAIAWSYHLLTDDAQVIFRRLAVFAGGCTLDAAEAVCSPAPSLPLDGIAILVDASLLRLESGADGMTRYRMLETIREFASEQLAHSGEVEMAQDAHAAFFTALVEQLRPHKALFADIDDSGRLTDELANLRAALAWLDASGRVRDLQRLAGLLGGFWLAHGHLIEGAAWLTRALDAGDAIPPIARCEIAVVLGTIWLGQGDPRRATEYLSAALPDAQGTGEPLAIARALIGLGVAATATEDHEDAIGHLEVALQHARSIPEQRLAAVVVSSVYANLGVAYRGCGRLADAATCHEEALRGRREAGHRWGVILSLVDLGDVSLDLDDVDRASECFRAALALACQHRELRAVADALTGLACVTAASGRGVHAARLFGATERLREQTGIAVAFAAERAAKARGVDLARTAAGKTALAASWAAGRLLSVDEAIEEALAESMPSEPSIRLTPREAEILRLIVAGQSDPAIAEALFISVRTVEHHVARLFAKFGVKSRTAAATAGIAAGLVPLPFARQD